MLALCEDAIKEQGAVRPEASGVYFRLVWHLGMTDAALKEYALQCHELANNNHTKAIYYPERALLQLNQDWMTEYPTPTEANIYFVNTTYLRELIDQLGCSAGKSMEELAEYLMLSMPGCRTARRMRSPSTDYDVVCSLNGFDIDYRSELGRYFVCECKDWDKPADFSAMAKFCRVLDSVKARFGIMFSRNGISGTGKAKDAELEQMKIFQDRGTVIVVVDKHDIEEVCKGTNFINLLRAKYEKVRLDLMKPK